MISLVLYTIAPLAFTLQPPTAGPQASIEQTLSAFGRQAAVVGAAVLLSVGPTPAALAENCQLDCFRECDAVAPGNKGYCSKQCDAYCEEVGNLGGQQDVLRTDPSEAAKVSIGAPGKDCDTYKTASAKQYCETQKEQAKMAAVTSKDLGLFGDSGVSYGSGVEDLLATIFGAKRQNKDVKQADVEGYTSEIAEAAKVAIIGGAAK